MGEGDLTNSIGQRGESIFYVIITRLYGRALPCFRPQFLGDKWPNVDFIVELMDVPSGMTPYFFVQVKATRQGYTKRTHRLKVKVPKPHIQQLASYPAPTYLVGIDECEEMGYIVSVKGAHRTGVTSMSTMFLINKETQDMLWQEVMDFWERVDVSHVPSQFFDPNWR